ncbi:hypothetical protein pb186bvf_000799 [Paramecium bursaria]
MNRDEQNIERVQGEIDNQGEEIIIDDIESQQLIEKVEIKIQDQEFNALQRKAIRDECIIAIETSRNNKRIKQLQEQNDEKEKQQKIFEENCWICQNIGIDGNLAHLMSA